VTGKFKVGDRVYSKEFDQQGTVVGIHEGYSYVVTLDKAVTKISLCTLGFLEESLEHVV
jgi:hypothetical protein